MFHVHIPNEKSLNNYNKCKYLRIANDTKRFMLELIIFYAILQCQKVGPAGVNYWTIDLIRWSHEGHWKNNTGGTGPVFYSTDFLILVLFQSFLTM